MTKEDNLPKKICDGCLYKLELLYQFWNTSANAEKQLLTWLSQAGVQLNKTSNVATSLVGTSHDENELVVLKQEALDPSETRVDSDAAISSDAQSYILQQQQLPYQPFQYGQPTFSEAAEQVITLLTYLCTKLV